ncbi:MAG: hypothetical protein WCF38_03805, partial [Pseudolabrys sp.]
QLVALSSGAYTRCQRDPVVSWLGAAYFAVMLSDRRKDNGGLKRIRTRFAIPQVPDATVINVL